jgi:hypothetical protein
LKNFVNGQLTLNPQPTALEDRVCHIRMLAYGTPADELDENLKLAASTTLECLGKWRNSLQGPQTNHASFYDPAKLQLPYLILISFSFPSMALPLHLQLTPS